MNDQTPSYSKGKILGKTKKPKITCSDKVSNPTQINTTMSDQTVSEICFETVNAVNEQEKRQRRKIIREVSEGISKGNEDQSNDCLHYHNLRSTNRHWLLKKEESNYISEEGFDNFLKSTKSGYRLRSFEEAKVCLPSGSICKAPENEGSKRENESISDSTKTAEESVYTDRRGAEEHEQVCGTSESTCSSSYSKEKDQISKSVRYHDSNVPNSSIRKNSKSERLEKGCEFICNFSIDAQRPINAKGTSTGKQRQDRCSFESGSSLNNDIEIKRDKQICHVFGSHSHDSLKDTFPAVNTNTKCQRLQTINSKEPSVEQCMPVHDPDELAFNFSELWFHYSVFKKALTLVKEESKKKQFQRNIYENPVLRLGSYEIELFYTNYLKYQSFSKLYMCEFCLKLMTSSVAHNRHFLKCPWQFPAGNEIYRKGMISVFEIDGKRSKMYSQNLCALGQLFLQDKSQCSDVEAFLFYVLTEADEEGAHIIGYFSKNRDTSLNYNVACLLILPQYQRKGYGQMLIDFSYLLSKVEGKVGTPERPFTDLGLISYRSYWKKVIFEYLSSHKDEETLSIKKISQETSIAAADIVSTLQSLGLLRYWKGKHIIRKRKDIFAFTKNAKKRNSDKIIDRSLLQWDPHTHGNNA